MSVLQASRVHGELSEEQERIAKKGDLVAKQKPKVSCRAAQFMEY